MSAINSTGRARMPIDQWAANEPHFLGEICAGNINTVLSTIFSRPC